MSKAVILGLGAAALSLAACTPPHPHVRALKTISTLDCPQSAGDLTRKAAAADGKSCLYASDEGEVSLQLVALNGADATAALAPIETSLRAELPAAAGGGGSTGGGQAAGSGGSDKDRVDIDLPGIHIHARGDDTAKVNVGGVSINARDRDGGDHVTVNGGPASAGGGAAVNVQAGDQGAEIHVSEPGAGVRRTVVLTSDTPGPRGYRSVGYQARGPLAGPIVVAVFKSRSNDREGMKDDVRDLLRDNVGG